MLEQWLSSGDWTHEQWLVLSILIFMVIAVLVVIYRLYVILKSTTVKRQPPNLRGGIRRLRR